MRRRGLLAALTIVTALQGVEAAAQDDLGRFHSFSARAPHVSGEITLRGTMGSPEGAYRILVPHRGATPDMEATFQVEDCRRLDPTAAQRRENEGDVHVECEVIEVIRSMCEGCDPRAIRFGRVHFARYISPIADGQGRPAIDNWTGTMTVGIRRVRLLIRSDRFIYQTWGQSDPNITIVEAPIRRLSNRSEREP